MRGKRIGLLLAAGIMLFAMSGCSAAEEEASSSSATAAPTQEATATPEPEASETAEETAAQEEPVRAEVDQAQATVTYLGTISAIDSQEKKVGIAEGEVENNAQDAVEAIVTDSTVLIDAKSGSSVAFDDLKEDMSVYAFVSPMMTRSIPPQSNAKALIVNISDSQGGAANYIYALEVRKSEDGSLVILNQNADLYVTIPKNVKMTQLGSGEDVSPDDIKDGSVLICWYDSVAESYPAQATATRVVVCPPSDETASASPSQAARAADNSGSQAASDTDSATAAPASADESDAPAAEEEGEEEMAVGDY